MLNEFIIAQPTDSKMALYMLLTMTIMYGPELLLKVIDRIVCSDG